MISEKSSEGTKVALLIGVSKYGEGFSQLPGAVKDVEAMHSVLAASDLGNFDCVRVIDSTLEDTRQKIKSLFTDRTENDIVLLYFSGHGIKDVSNQLYLGTQTTHKNSRGELVEHSAISARYIHELMDSCCSKQQIIILDCCFSGAFPEGLLSKDDSSIDIRIQFSGEGRVILTSSNSIQLSFGERSAEISPYTRCLVEGIYTGKADLDGDHWISVHELHQYIKSKIQARFPTLKPEIYPDKSEHSLLLSKVPLNRSLNHLIKIRNEESRLINTLIAQARQKILRPKVAYTIGILIILAYFVRLLLQLHCNDLINRWDEQSVFLSNISEKSLKRKACKAVNVYLP